MVIIPLQPPPAYFLPPWKAYVFHVKNFVVHSYDCFEVFKLVTVSPAPGYISLFSKQARNIISCIITTTNGFVHVRLSPATTPIRCNSWVLLITAFASFSERN